MTTPYYEDDLVTLYHGDCRQVLPELDAFDLVLTDPPYAETSLEWDRWPDGWPTLAADRARPMWCFGTMRMFLERRDEFAAWRMSQDIIWEKQSGTSFATDRLMRVHEHALHFYRGSWFDLYHVAPRVGHRGPDKSVRRKAVGKGHHGDRGASTYVDDGQRQLRSVIFAANMHGKNLHPTEKPTGLLENLIEYACPPPRVRPRSLRRVRVDAGCCEAHWPPRSRDRGTRGLLRGHRQAARAGHSVRRCRMSVREVLCYTIACDWPGCDATADDESEYVCWGDVSDAWESASNMDGHRGQGDAWFCHEHLTIWSSDHESGEPYPATLFLLIHDGMKGFEDGTVTLVEHLHAGEPCLVAAVCPHRVIAAEAAHYDTLVTAEGVQ